MSVAGTFSIPVQTPAGQMNIVLKMKVKGNKVSGSTKVNNAEVSFTGGSVDGNEFKFTVSEKTPMGIIDLKYNGSVDGDKITGQVFTPMGAKFFNGSRV